MERASLIVAVCCVLGLAVGPARAAETVTPTGWLPEDTLLVVEMPQPKGLLDLLTGPAVRQFVESLPDYRKAAESGQLQQLRDLVAYLETRLGTNWQDGLHKLLDGGVTLATTGTGKALIVAEAEDTGFLDSFNDVVLEIIRGELVKQGHAGPVPSNVYKGVTGWSFGPGEAHAIMEGRLLFSNDPNVLKAVVDRREGSPGVSSLAAVASYPAARAAADPDADVVLVARMAALRQAPKLRQLLSGDNPLGSLALAALQEALKQANWVTVSVSAKPDRLAVKVATDGGQGEPAGPAAFAVPPTPDEGALPNLRVPGRLAAASLYRDLHGFYGAKDDLFPQRTSGLIFFENMMGIFFSGRDLTDEVLAEIEPHVRLVVAEQTYDPTIGTPAVRIPGFALVLKLNHPDRFARVLEEAWQKAIGLNNFTRGQKALPGLIIDRQEHNGTTYTVAYFAADDDADKNALEVRYNVRPTLAFQDGYAVIASADGITRDILDALAEEARPMPGVHTCVELDGTGIASVLDANRENMVRQNMVEKGNTMAQAEAETGLLIGLLSRVGPATLTMGGTGRGTLAELTIAPAGEAGRGR
jgi:hypothetical protein